MTSRLGRMWGNPLWRVMWSCAALILAAACSKPVSNTGTSARNTLLIGGRDYSADERIQYKLPKVLREISGLALDQSGRLFAHNDEDGVIYEIDYHAGKVVRRFALDGIAHADFEGIAVAGGRVFLVTSRGAIVETVVGEPEQTVPTERHSERLDCEVEGLTFLPDQNGLLAACKNFPKQDPDVGLRLHLWDLDKAAYDPARVITVAWPVLTATPGIGNREEIQPSGITRAANGNLIIVAGRQSLLIELTPEGAPVRAARLDKGRHRQTEGIEITTSGILILADEGDGEGSNKSRGRLSVYVPAD